MQGLYIYGTNLALAALLAGCGLEPASEQASTRDLEGSPAENAGMPDLSEARRLWQLNNYERAIELYRAQKLNNYPKLRFERAQLLQEAGGFYEVLGEFAAELQTDMLLAWERDQARGEMLSYMLPCFAAIGAYERGDFAHAVSLQEHIEEERVDAAWVGQALLAGAVSYLRLGEEGRGMEIIEKLKLESRDPAFKLRIYRILAEEGKPLPEDMPIVVNDPSNATLLDLAWIHLHRGEVERALQALQAYDSGEPLAEEAFEDKREGETRKFYAIGFLPLLTQVYYHLAAEDWRQLAEEEGMIGLSASYMLGLALQGANLQEEAAVAFSRFIRRLDRERQNSSYLSYLRQLARIYQGRALAVQGQHEKAQRLWDRVTGGKEISDLALRVNRLRAEMENGGAIVQISELQLIYERLTEIQPKFLESFEYTCFYDASLVAAEIFRATEAQHREKAIRLLEKLHPKSNGYDPQNVDPQLLVRMARAYYTATKIQWSFAKKIIGSLNNHYAACLPVLEIFGYVLADFGDQPIRGNVTSSGG